MYSNNILATTFRDYKPENVISLKDIYIKDDIIVFYTNKGNWSGTFVRIIPFNNPVISESFGTKKIVDHNFGEATFYCPENDTFYKYKDACITPAYDLEKAFEYFSKGIYLNDEHIKRIRQVRDALNKCKNADLIEQIGKLLNI